MTQDNRWIQRFHNFRKALDNLGKAVALTKTRSLSHLEKQGLIHAFEITYDLAWNTIKDFYKSKGTAVQGSRNAFKTAAGKGLVTDGEVFVRIIKSRQLSTFSFNEETADQITNDIVEEYFEAFKGLEKGLGKENKA